MKFFNMDIKDLKFYEKNAKKHNKVQVKKIAESIKNFGFRQPVLIDKDNTIIVGHGRVMAAEMLGIKEVRKEPMAKKGELFIPVMSIEDLTDDEIKLYRLADNKLNESGWEMDLVIDELKDFDEEMRNLTGFTDEELVKDDKVEGEVEFTTEILEENNYLVFVFDSVLDWQVIEDKFGLKTVKALDSEDEYMRKGVGRVLSGKQLLTELK